MLSGFKLPSWVRAPSRWSRDLILGLSLGGALTLSAASWFLYKRAVRRRIARMAIADEDDFTTTSIDIREDAVLDGVTELIGNTPLIRIKSLSSALGVEILGKAEFLNPGGSVKDRVALRIIDNAEHRGLIKPHTGSRIFEGTSGSTGISIATIAGARGYEATIIMPTDVSEDKVKALLALGANVERVKPASIVDKKQFVNLAKQRAMEFRQEGHDGNRHLISNGVVVSMKEAAPLTDPITESRIEHAPRGFFADQFENTSNFDAHYEGTGPEIWRQTNGNVDAFVSGAGTGGTIAGVGTYLKTQNKAVVIALADPQGSGLHNKIKHGVMFDPKEKEGTKRRDQVDSIIEGIGLNRLTKNLERGLPIIDESIRVSDSEAISMSRYISKHDGLFLGSSSACNLVACVRLALSKDWKKGERIVTILCDSGMRHYSKFWNDDFLRESNIPIDNTFVPRLLKGEA